MCVTPSYATMPEVKMRLIYPFGRWMQFVVMRMAPGNAENSLNWFCHAVP